MWLLPPAQGLVIGRQEDFPSVVENAGCMLISVPSASHEIFLPSTELVFVNLDFNSYFIGERNTHLATRTSDH